MKVNFVSLQRKQSAVVYWLLPSKALQSQSLTAFYYQVIGFELATFRSHL